MSFGFKGLTHNIETLTVHHNYQSKKTAHICTAKIPAFRALSSAVNSAHVVTGNIWCRG
jgi:hypothetical protein